MCGIIGAVAKRDVSKMLLEGLKRLEYRGYDSAGIAVIDDKGRLKRIRVTGKVQSLVDATNETHISGETGIAHTRWATHGKPCELNAHPLLSHGELAVVHNGIIENHDNLRAFLQDAGYRFTSETDTEVAAHLIHYHYQRTEDLLRAVQEAASIMEGAFALGVLHQKRPGEIVAIRRGSPLVAGFGNDEFFIASDALALRTFADKVLYLEDGDSVMITQNELNVFDDHFLPVERPRHSLPKDSDVISKGSYDHFMLKEIFEQTRVLSDALEGRIASHEIVKASFGERLYHQFPLIEAIHIVACGTSYHAGLVAKYWIETAAAVPVSVEIASEYRYRQVVVPKNALFITISQSGETADTLAALSKAKTKGYLATLAICNNATSSLVRESDSAFLTRAGIEIGVASTKAFTTQLVAMLMLATALSDDEPLVESMLHELHTLPLLCESFLKMNDIIKEKAKHFVNKNHVLFLGRGVYYPIALEGALKLKEISYIHAEAYPAGELKHGPLALVDADMSVIALLPNDPLSEKMKSNLHEVRARGGDLCVFSDEQFDSEHEDKQFILLPQATPWISPILYTIPLQLLAYHVAVLKNTDVDQPRNLAKSVTVE